MTLKDRIRQWVYRRQKEVERGRVVIEKDRAKKERAKLQKARYYEPGTIKYGLANKQNPAEVMQDAYQRRKRLREEKQR